MAASSSAMQNAIVAGAGRSYGMPIAALPGNQRRPKPPLKSLRADERR
jgi:hypothetical protein